MVEEDVIGCAGTAGQRAAREQDAAGAGRAEPGNNGFVHLVPVKNAGTTNADERGRSAIIRNIAGNATMPPAAKKLAA